MLRRPATPPPSETEPRSAPDWRDGLAAELARKLDLDPEVTLYPRLAAGATLTAFDTVLHRWSTGDGSDDPAELTTRAFAVIAPALDTVEG